jgi:hypothetical protein
VFVTTKNILTGPVIFMLLLTYVAEIWGELTLTSMIGQIWLLPFLIYLNVVNTTKVDKWIIWAVVSLLLGYPNGMSLVLLSMSLANFTAHPIQVAWNSRNANTVRSRTVSAACYNMFVQAGGIISANIYRAG